MNRSHYTIAYAIIIILLSIPLIYKYHVAMDIAEESEKIDRILYNSMYAGLITYNQNPQITDNGEHICRSFMNFLSKQSNISEEELWGYVPVFVILDTSEYYMIFPGLYGRDYSRICECPYIYNPEEIDYETYFFGGGILPDDTSFYGLDGEINGTEEIMELTGGALSDEALRGMLQIQIEESVNTAIAYYNKKRNENDFHYEVITDLVLTPDKSIIAVFQGYPINSAGTFYNNTYKMSGQVQRVE